jgi:hypothetical protein
MCVKKLVEGFHGPAANLGVALFAIARRVIEFR